ncbi:VOC family protein [Alkalicoccobacillus porphyridii]|uniref:VOC family protein n=1 Tax=Alkalicoccobacillus porphyridii TaxID=2597270 RepID=A0A553ZX02_9BACI|nr:VOC family protein [Alkalicoccobacillus porphyridii]TSB45990.1 VOC family protein [Alkalicoccobacillus porphyridii]
MEGKLIFYFVPVHDLQKAIELYRDTLGFTETWREGEYTVSFSLPGSDVELMIEQMTEGSPTVAGPVFLVPSVNQVILQYQQKLDFVSEPTETPDGLWISAKDDSGNGLYFTDESKIEASHTGINVS